MRKEKFGKLTVWLTGGTDGKAGGDGPLCVLLHGFGAPGTDLVGIGQELQVNPSVRFAFPEAPISLGGMFGDGRAWWHIDMERLQRLMFTGGIRNLMAEEPEGLTAAREMLVESLSAIETKLNVKPQQVVLGGFSQGAMLSCDTVLRTQRDFAGLVMMSGTFLAEHIWKTKFTNRANVPVFMSHGTADPLLPFQLAELLRDSMSSAGLNVDWISFRGGHGVAPEVITRLEKFLAKAWTSTT